MKPSLKALIPVRSGSLRIPNKNIIPFAGSSLLEIKINQLKLISGIDEICVSSNDEGMLELSRSLGARPMPRDPIYASNDIPMSEVYSYMAKQMDTEHILLTHVTNPLTQIYSYEEAIKIYSENATQYDSLTSVAKVNEFLYLEGKPLNFDPTKKPRSQDLPNIQKLTHAISILPRDTMIQKKDAVGYTPFFLELSQEESFDIDVPLDFEIAEFIYKSRNSKKPLM